MQWDFSIWSENGEKKSELSATLEVCRRRVILLCIGGKVMDTSVTAVWGPLRNHPQSAAHFIYTRRGCCTFPLNLIIDTSFPPLFHTFYLSFLYWGSIQEMISQWEKSQTGTGRFIALAAGHLISAQKVMKSLKWPKQFKFARRFHMPERVPLCYIGGIAC